MGIVARGVAKLILFGEYSVLWDFPGLGVSLDMETRIADGGYREIPRDFLHFVNQVLQQTLSRLECLSVTSSVPIANGLGSSAALCVALARHILQKTSVWEMAHRLEQFFHRPSSGIDTGLAEELPGTVCKFTFTGGELPEKIRTDIPSGSLVFAGIVRSSSTLYRVASIIGNSHPFVRRAITRLGEITQWAIQHLYDWKAVAQVANVVQKEFSLLGLSDPLIEEVIQVGKNAGAWGGKMSGSGGSFCLFCADAETAHHVKQKIEQKLAAHATVMPQIINFSSSFPSLSD